MKVFGCRSNQFDAEALAHLLTVADYRRVSHLRDASILIVVGCSVTHRADRDVRQAVRRARRDYPEMKIYLAGCSAGLPPPEGVDGIIPMKDRDRVVEVLNGLTPDGACDTSIFFQPVRTHLGRTRVLVKIQEGCNNNCAYCIVPRLRGRARSLPGEEVIRHCLSLIRAGVKEIILTGTHLGSYGRDLPGEEDFITLLGKLDALPGSFRWRLSSLEPWSPLLERVDLLGGMTKMCPFLHLPLQNGSAEILRVMRRPMTPDHFARIIQYLRRVIPSIRIGTDVIVGFPGESDFHFDESLRFLEEIRLDYHHIFSYSPRPGSDLSPPPPSGIVRERYDRVRRFDNACRMREMESRIDEEMIVLGTGRAGIDPYNHTVEMDPAPPEGDLAACIVESIRGENLVGRMV